MLTEIHGKKQSNERLMPKHPHNYHSGNEVVFLSNLLLIDHKSNDRQAPFSKFLILLSTYLTLLSCSKCSEHSLLPRYS